MEIAPDYPFAISTLCLQGEHEERKGKKYKNV